MKKQIFIFMIVLCLALPFISALPFCSQDNYLNYIPCLVYTPGLNCSANAYIYQTSNNNSYANFALSLVNPSCTGNCVYKFTFNVTTPGSYYMQLCDNSHSSINVYESTTTNKYPLFFKLDFSKPIYLILLVVMFIIAVLLMINRLFVFGGFLFTIIGFTLLFSDINILISGIFIIAGMIIVFIVKKGK